MNPTPEPDPSPPVRRPGPGRGTPPERRAYPTAPTLTRPSYARPGSTRRSRTPRTPPPIPATVWTCPPALSELTGAPAPAGTWAAAVIAEIVLSFSEPHSRVGLLPWPSIAVPLAGTHRLSVSDMIPSDRTPDTGPAAGEELSEAITAQHRTPILLSLPTVPGGPATDRAWESSRQQPQHTAATVSPSVPSSVSPTSPEAVPTAQRSRLRDEPVAPLDLIISSAAPVLVDEASATRVALAVGPALRLGGVLAVLTHSHHMGGRLIDPGGVLVSAAQNADLLYLQHIVVLYTAISEPAAATRADSEPADAQARGWPVRHRRTHGDLYVFGQPHDHYRPEDNSLEGAASAAGAASIAAFGEAR